MISKETSFSSSWSKEQEKEFENALAIHAEDCADRWEKIAAAVNGKSTDEIKHHYELLVEDINGIESGRVPLPSYSSDSPLDQSNETGSSKKNGNLGNSQSDSSHGGKGSKSEQERRKGVAWTEDEHRLFLLGLEKYGKGDWRSISRNFVVSRTPTQVASHAQKYFIRLNSMNKDRRRTSIHDITSVGNGETSASPGPITGQANAPLGSTTKSTKQSSQLPIPGPAIGMYGAPTIGQPVPGPMVSALGMPVNLPTSHMAYGVRATVPGIVPGAPMTMSPVTYPVQHTSGHR